MPLIIISRKDAIAAGLRRFYTGAPCKKGHYSERRVSRGSRCIECERIWKAAHHISHAEPNRVRGKAWYEANKERINDRRRTNRTDAKRYQEHREHRLIQIAAYHAAHPEVRSVSRANRRARQRNSGERHTGEEIRTLLNLQKSRCANSLCKRSLKGGYHADHIMPLALGGGNSIRNIQLLCPPCNLGKGPMHPIDWAQSHGALL